MSSEYLKWCPMQAVCTPVSDTVPAVAVETFVAPASPSDPAARASALAMRSIAPLMRFPLPSEPGRLGFDGGGAGSPRLGPDANGYERSQRVGFSNRRQQESLQGGDTGEVSTVDDAAVRLTTFSHGAGCACKL